MTGVLHHGMSRSVSISFGLGLYRLLHSLCPRWRHRWWRRLHRQRCRRWRCRWFYRRGQRGQRCQWRRRRQMLMLLTKSPLTTIHHVELTNIVCLLFELNNNPKLHVLAWLSENSVIVTFYCYVRFILVKQKKYIWSLVTKFRISMIYNKILIYLTS